MAKTLIAFLKRHYGVLLVLLFTIFTIVPLTRSGFWPMHDNEQVGRLYDLHQALTSGHFPPRIAPNLGYGYGYPFFNFYPSFVYYVAEIFLLTGFSYIDSIKLMIASGFFFAAVAMYIFARKYLSVTGAIVAAVAYTYAPYHAVDVYVRGALPEFWSFVFLPAIFWAMKSLKDSRERKYMVLFGLFSAGLILTHNLVAVMSAVFILSYFGLLLWKSEKRQQFLFQFALGGIVAVSLSAYFWLPSYAEKQYTMIELLTKDLADYRQHFVYLRQFWNSPWGYGGSLYGLYDGLSFEIGKLHIIGVILTLGILPFIRKQRLLVIFFLGAFAFAAFMATFRSQVIWDAIQPLSYIQFPWRFLLFTAFFSSFLVGFVISSLRAKKLQVIGFFVIALMLVVYTGNFAPERYYTGAVDDDYIDEDYIRWDTSKLAAEYVPNGIATRETDIGTLVVDIDEQQIASRSSEIVSGIIARETEEIENLPQQKEFIVHAETPVVFRINTYTFPGWKVFVDGKEMTYNDRNKYRLITIPVPPGQHTVTARLTDTPVRSIGNILSLISILCLLLFFVSSLVTQRYRKHAKTKS